MHAWAHEREEEMEREMQQQWAAEWEREWANAAAVGTAVGVPAVVLGSATNVPDTQQVRQPTQLPWPEVSTYVCNLVCK